MLEIILSGLLCLLAAALLFRGRSGASAVSEHPERPQGSEPVADTNSRVTRQDNAVAENTSASNSSESEPWPWLSPNLWRVRRVLVEYHRDARLDVYEEMLEEDVQPTVENLQVKIVMLPRPELREEFREQGFDSSGDMWRVEHVFTSAAGRLQSVTLDSLFQDIPEKVARRGQTFRIVVISSAGCGKTTVFTKVAPFRWASGELWNDLFDMIFARELRCEDVRQAKNALDLLGLDRFHLSKDEWSAVLQYARDHPERLCLVLDGLDETSFKKCSSFVQEVICGKALRGIRLVLTSRPSGDIFKLTDSQPLDRKVELVGFRPEDVVQFVRKFLNANEAAQLLLKIRDNPHLLSMMSTPVLAYEICKLYHWRKQVPRCVADIFELMTTRLAERRSDFQYQNWKDIPYSVQAPILSLGSFAFSMLRDQQLVFSETELQSFSVLRDAIGLGLLIACDHTPADNSVKQWRFSHLTLQECLAAKFVACSGTMHGGKIVQLVECLGPDAGHMRTFWMLLAAQLDSSCLETLVNSLLFRFKTDQGLLSKMSVAEDRKLRFPMVFHGVLCEQLSRSSMNRLAEILLGRVVKGRATTLVESRMSRAHTPQDADFLETLLLTWTSEFPAASTDLLVAAVANIDENAAHLCRGLTQQTPAASLSAQSLPIPDDAYFSYGFHSDRRHLAFQCFAEYALHCDDAVEPVPSITACLKHKTGQIRILGKGSPWLCRTLDTVIMHHPRAVKHVWLSGFAENCLLAIAPSLRQCTEISTLEVGDRQSQWPALSDIIFRSSFTLSEITFLETSVTSMDMECLAPAISACSHLERITIIRTDLSLASVARLANALSAASSLRELVLHTAMGESVGDAAVPVLCSALSTCSNLENLDLSKCSLSASSLPVIAASLHHWAVNMQVHLLHNDLSRASEEQCKPLMEAVDARGRLVQVNLCATKLPPDCPLRKHKAFIIC